MNRLLFSSLCTLGVAFFFSSCASTPRTADLKAKECQDNLAKAEKALAKESYLRAKEILEPLADECIGSGVTEKSMFLLAEASYGLEDWIGARSDYSIYLGQYPNSEYSAMAAYKKALSSYNLPYKRGRDGSFTQNAIEDFETFIYRYSGSNKLDSAKILLNELRERLASDHRDIGTLYLRMGEPGAAVVTFKDFMEQHPESALVPSVLEDMIHAYVRLDQYSQAWNYLDTLHQYVDSTSSQSKSLYAEIDHAEKAFDARIQSENEFRKKTQQN